MSNMDLTPLPGIEVGGIAWSVDFNPLHHNFLARSPGFPQVTSDSWDQMEDAVKKAVAKSKIRVSVPYARLTRRREGSGMVPVLVTGVATSINAGSRKVMARQDGQSTALDSGDSALSYLTPFEPEEEAALLRLASARAALDDEIRAITERHRFPEGSLYQRVYQLIDDERRRQIAEASE
jgi:hypothetical protein